MVLDFFPVFGLRPLFVCLLHLVGFFQIHLDFSDVTLIKTLLLSSALLFALLCFLGFSKFPCSSFVFLHCWLFLLPASVWSHLSWLFISVSSQLLCAYIVLLSPFSCQFICFSTPITSLHYSCCSVLLLVSIWFWFRAWITCPCSTFVS